MNPRFKGRQHTPETREKIAAALRGRKRPPEVCARIAAGKTGVPQAPEHRAKIAEARRREGFFARKWDDPEFRAAASKRSKERMARRWREDPEFAERARERMRVANAIRRTGALYAVASAAVETAFVAGED